MRSPVLVLAAVPRMATTVARSLHRYGIAVDVATFSAIEPRIRSNSVRHFFRVPDPDVSQDDFVTALSRLIQQYGHDLLIPGNDVALTAIAENYDHFDALLKLACPSPHVVERVLNKEITLAIASQCGLETPRSVLLANTHQLPELAREVGFPCVIKPGQKQRVEDFKTRVVRDHNDIARSFPEPREFSPPMLLQESCPGVGVGLEILMHEGKCLAVFQHRRIKEYPHAGGVAVLAVAETPGPALVDASTRLLQALEWDGVAMVEFRVDPSTGRAVLMEVNGRIWGSISLPVLAGMDFPLYTWQLSQGQEPHVPEHYAVGTRWRWTAGYLQRLNGLILAKLKGRASGSLIRELWDLRSDFGGSTRDSLWNLRDPMPAIYELLTTVRAIVIFDIKAMITECSRRLVPGRRLAEGPLKRPAEPNL